MIQLKCYNGPIGVIGTTQTFLDLYDTEPIKLTISIEDIQTANATSVFSKAFKVPGTRKNAEFFKNSFDVDGILYDVTVKKPAEILVDGAQFKQGHIRLQKVFLNTEQDQYDYELLFLGETRDFSTVIGDGTLCQLNLTDLIGGATGGSFIGADTVLSWDAYPQTDTGFASDLTAGLHGGDIIYPLIDHGNTYDSAGILEQIRIGFGGADTFYNHNLGLDRLKPMIRAKRIFDEIFASAGYTYTSDFLTSRLFHQMYISAFGNSATVTWDQYVNSNNIAQAQENTSVLGPQHLTQAVNDPGSNLSTITFNYPGGSFFDGMPATVYTVPAFGEYQIAGQCLYQGYNLDENGDPIYDGQQLFLYNVTTNVNVATSNVGPGYGTVIQFNVIINTSVDPIAPGDQLMLLIGDHVYGPPTVSLVQNSALNILKAPGDFNPGGSLDCNYKQIDFIKDMLTAFRLVLSPDPNNVKNFIIEPWQQYINSGDVLDWSHKLVENKDVQIEPVFFTQSEVMNFRFKPGMDYGNIYNQQAYVEPYGWLKFTSGNDLLKGTRDITLSGISPTILLNIENTDPVDNFNIAQLHTHSAENSGLQHRPIKPKTRFLFYNGLQNINNSQHYWLLEGTDGGQASDRWAVFPLVSPYETWPITTGSLNLNWANDIQYWGTSPGYNQIGASLYDNYWTRYINSLYGKYSRRVTATFTLNNQDLNNFSFDDTIFVNGTYYIPEKIMDVQIGELTECKVQLLTANDYKPVIATEYLDFEFTATGFGGPCASGSGGITIVTNGTPAFDWVLSNGQSGTGLLGSPFTGAPYTFNINNIAVGNYNITITDALGRTSTIAVSVPASSATPVIATQITTDASDCSICDGQVTVTPSGGDGGPYTIQWLDGSTAFTRTGLCPQVNYLYTVLDSIGCGFQSYVVNVGCESGPGDVWEFFKSSEDCTQILISPVRRVFYSNLVAPPILGDFYKLTDLVGTPIDGCWTPVQIVAGPADSFEVAHYVTCAACNALPAIQIYEAINCSTGETIIVNGTVSTVPGGIYNLEEIEGCWEIGSTSIGTPIDTVTTGQYYDCAACLAVTPQGMLTNLDQTLGTPTQFCSSDHSIPIYNNLTNDAHLITPGSFMYTDALLTTPFDGADLWYSIANIANPNLSAVAIRISASGLVYATHECS